MGRAVSSGRHNSPHQPTATSWNVHLAPNTQPRVTLEETSTDVKLDSNHSNSMNLNHKQATAMLLATSYFIVLFTASLSRAAVIVAPPPSPTSISQAGPQADLALANESPTSRSSQDPQQQQQSQSTQMTSSNQLMGEMSQAQQQQQQQQTVMSNSIGTAHSSQMVSSPTSGGSPPMSPMGGQQPLRLPRINIYASRSEVKKLLGKLISESHLDGSVGCSPLRTCHIRPFVFTA